VQCVFVVQAADGDDGGRRGRRQDACTAPVPFIAGRADNHDAGTHGFFGPPREVVGQVRSFLVVGARDVQDANAVVLAVFQHPLDAALDVRVVEAVFARDLTRTTLASGATPL
jgi:hypothetical protein